MAETDTQDTQDTPGGTLEGTLAPDEGADIPDPAVVDWTAGDPVVLAFEDLLPDDGGEVVADAGGGHLELRGTHSVVASGVAETHVTAGGYDVSGFSFVQFDNGLTVYVGEDTLLTVSPDVA